MGVAWAVPLVARACTIGPSWSTSSPSSSRLLPAVAAAAAASSAAWQRRWRARRRRSPLKPSSPSPNAARASPLAPLWVLALLASCATAPCAADQRFAMEPQDQTAIVGSRVTLPCRVVNKTGALQWTKDDFGLGTHRNLTGFERYRMIGSDEEGDFSLEIYPVMLDDDARYQCQVSPGPTGEPRIRSKFATLTVLVPPEPPRIVQGDFLVTTEDREIELECVSLAGKPAAEITWIDGLGNVMTEGLDEIVEALPDGRRFTSKSILKLTPKKEHHNTTFTCQAQNTADRTYRSAKLRLEVKYAPKVTLSITSGRLTEGSEVRLACRADANPLDLTYRWFINDEEMAGDFTTEFIIPNISRRYHDAIVKCEVHNPVGKSEESETLDISYGPRFRTRPKSVQTDQGTTVTLTCDVDGNPPPDIVWIHEDAQKVVGTSVNLTLDVDKRSAGRYYCKASVQGFHEIGAEATIMLKGKPTISSALVQFGIPGDNVRLECLAFSVPKPEHVIWTFKGNEVDASDKDYTILEDPLPEGIKSTLVIRESRDQHFGPYNCSVANSYGSDTVEILLKAQKTFPLLMILVGVIGGVIIIIAIAMIIILCQRREKKPQDCRDAEKQCKESDRSSNISDLKMELRTGSSVSNVHCELEYGPDSETGSESVVTRVGMPLAGPVAMPVNGGENIYRYSSDFTEPIFPPKDGQNNNGYVPYVDYSRDFNPAPPTALGIESSRESLSIPNIDPRYSAAYGNPYLRNSSTSLPAPHATHNTHVSHAVGPTPAPPPYTASTRNGAVPQVARLPHSPTTQYIVPNSQPTAVKRGTLATHV